MQHRFSDLNAFRRDPLEFHLKHECHSDAGLIPVRVQMRPFYLVNDPDLFKPVLKATEADFDKGRMVYKMRQIVGDSSLIISGEEHRRRRAVLAQVFREGLGGPWVDDMQACIREFVGYAARQSDISAREFSAQMALRIVSTVLFGKNTLSPGDENALVAAVRLVEEDVRQQLFQVLPDTPWSAYRKRRQRKHAHRILDLVVARTKANAAPDSLLGKLKDLDLSARTLRDEILLMLLAGHHTSGTAATWLLYHIATEKGLGEALAEEAEELYDGSGDITTSAIKRAHLSRAVVQETLRLYPSTYWLTRETMRPVELAGHKLRKGTTLMISPWRMHRSERYWDRPEEFDLGRTYAGKPYMPFGLGARACVGQAMGMAELQLMALEFASALNFQVTSQVPAAPPEPSVTLVPSDIRLRVTPRQRQAAVVEWRAAA